MRTSTSWGIAPCALGAMLALAGGAGCGFRATVTGGDDASTADTPMGDIDAGVPIDGGPNCFGSGLVQICLQALPTAPITLGSQTIDTATSPMCVPFTSIPAGLSACVIAGTLISQPNGTFRAEGTLPLVVVASGDITIGGSGVIDVASHRGGTVGGAASNASQCLAGVTPTQAGGTGGGGYGGSFGGAGGNGNSGVAGGNGGIAAPASGTPTVVRGGCPGSQGADGGSGSGGGTPGAGGGAVVLIARGKIQIDGEINASGSAGRGGGDSTQAGAGGGGSGGLIALDASMVTVSGGAHVWANGAGGGDGASSFAGGAPGNDSSGPAAAGTGGTGGTTAGGDGGASSVSGTIGGGNGGPGSISGLSAGAGGAGGGGAGVILIRAAAASGTNKTANVAPPPS